MAMGLRAERVTMASVSRVDALNVSQFGQQIERSIHCCQAQMWIPGFGLVIDFGRC